MNPSVAAIPVRCVPVNVRDELHALAVRGSAGGYSRWTALSRKVRAVFQSASTIPTPAANAECARLVELAGRMSVPADYAIHEFIKLGRRLEVTAGRVGRVAQTR